MGEFLDYFKQKKNLTNLLLVGILTLALPVGIQVMRQQQIIKSKAASDAVIFVGSDVAQKSDGTWTSRKPQVSFQITSPFGPPGNTSNINLNPPQVVILVSCLPKQVSTGEILRVSWVNPPTPVNKITIKEVNSAGNNSYNINVTPQDTSMTAPVGFTNSSNIQLAISPDAVYAVSVTGDMESGPTNFSIPVCK